MDIRLSCSMPLIGRSIPRVLLVRVRLALVGILQLLSSGRYM